MHGPVFSDVLLADKSIVQRPVPKAALFEAMSERRVTIDNTRHKLSDSFFVVATQNQLKCTELIRCRKPNWTVLQ